MKKQKRAKGMADIFSPSAAVTIIRENEQLIDNLVKYDVGTIMGILEYISNKEGVPVTTILRVIWALEEM